MESLALPPSVVTQEPARSQTPGYPRSSRTHVQLTDAPDPYEPGYVEEHGVPDDEHGPLLLILPATAGEANQIREVLQGRATVQ